MGFCKYFNHKLLLTCCNLMFMVCGIILLFTGFYLFTDTQRIILSRLLAATSEKLADLPHPLFFYIALILAVSGTISILASVLGFWASCLSTYCFLSIYFLAIVMLLLIESAICLAIILWPQCLGLNLNETKMVKTLQGNYGVPGYEQFTIAIDLLQQNFECCGINSDINYDTSLWRLQLYGQREWTVPLTCCKLYNKYQKFSYLDPKPMNLSQCQALVKYEYENSRHTEPCIGKLDNWYREQYVIFLSGSFIVAIIEFCVLLSIILNCTKISEKQKRKDNCIELRPRQKSEISLVENVYEPDVTSSIIPAERYPGEIKEFYIQPPDLCKNRHNTTFKPTKQNYQISKSYLV